MINILVDFTIKPQKITNFDTNLSPTVITNFILEKVEYKFEGDTKIQTENLPTQIVTKIDKNYIFLEINNNFESFKYIKYEPKKQYLNDDIDTKLDNMKQNNDGMIKHKRNINILEKIYLKR